MIPPIRLRASHPAQCAENARPSWRAMRRPIEIGHLDTNGDWQRDRTDWRPRLERVVPSSFSTLTYVDETGELAALRADDFWRRRRLLRDISCVIPDAQVWNEHISAFKAGAA